ncbi:hypothetical protein ACI78T_15670 [Blastococcus sp. SYSU D00922]
MTAAPEQDHGHRRPGRVRTVVRHPATRWAALLLLIALDLAIPLAYAREWERVLPTMHLDGAFQTASGLFRLGAGEWPGRDFLPYLGIAPVALLYPVFELRGGDLAATVFAARFTTLVALQIVFGVLAALVFRRRSAWVFAWAAAVPVLVLEIASLSWQNLLSFDETCGGCLGLVALAGDPGTSLRPIRTFAPYALAGIAYLVMGSGWRLRTRSAVVGACAGVVGALWSNDYGLVSAGLLLAVLGLHVLGARGERRVLAIGLLGGSAVLAYVAAGFGATAGHFVTYLRYNFSDVRGDQFWYFGPWDEASRVYSVGDLLRIMAGEAAVYPLVVLAAVLAHAAWRRDLAALLLAYTGTTLFLGGVVGTFGGHSGTYFWAFVLWGYIVTALAAARLLPMLLVRAARSLHPDLGGRVAAGLRVAVVVSLVVTLVLVDRAAVTAGRAAGRALVADPAYTFEPRLGGFLDSRFVEHVDEFRDRDAAVVEEYMGLAGALTGSKTDLPFDSVIAAVGSQREVFADRMAERPDVVVTTAPQMDEWITWNLSANWWFYRTLFQGYAPEQTSPNTLVWKRDEPVRWTSTPCRVGSSGIELDAPSAGMYEVTLRYTGPGRNARAYTMVQNNINMVLTGEGFVALDPGAAMQRIPVVVNEPGTGTTRLPLRDVPDRAAGLTALHSCSASSVAVPDGARTMELFSRLFRTPAIYSDWDWTAGVSRTEPVLLVPNTLVNQDDLQSAGAIRFSDGEVRTIDDVEPGGIFIRVVVDGPPLDPTVAGYPNRFELLP